MLTLIALALIAPKSCFGSFWGECAQAMSYFVPLPGFPDAVERTIDAHHAQMAAQQMEIVNAAVVKALRLSEVDRFRNVDPSQKPFFQREPSDQKDIFVGGDRIFVGAVYSRYIDGYYHNVVVPYILVYRPHAPPQRVRERFIYNVLSEFDGYSYTTNHYLRNRRKNGMISEKDILDAIKALVKPRDVLGWY